MGITRFSRSAQNKKTVSKWKTIHYFIKTFGWTLEDVKKLTVKEATEIMMMEEQPKKNLEEEGRKEAARRAAENMLKNREDG